MHFTVDKHEKYVVIKLHEEKLNTLISADLKAELVVMQSQGFDNIILDLTDTKYCDSSGLSAILVGNRICKNANGTFVLTGLNDVVKKLVEISQLNNVLVITPTLSEAIDIVIMDEVERDITDEK
ncbi:MAG: STAS domain-containing protein [Bacteroidia bacterium]|nr:STAS domain-containing protein [Bacteroidia bacterium]NNM16469.1 STAS domain-containing protein [Bacteroidia bacterium]